MPPRKGRSPRDRTDAVLIDMDDTLFDHALTCRAAIAGLRPRFGYLRRRPLDDLWLDYRQRLDADGAKLRSGRWNIDAARRERWRRLALSCGQRLGAAELTAVSTAYRELYLRRRRGVPGARTLVAAVHRTTPVVVVTNNEVAEQEEKVRFLGIGPFLDGLVVSAAVGVEKPDRRIFEAALDVAGARAERTTMLGDSWASDVLGARSAGLRAVWFNRFGLAPPPGARVPELRSLRPARAARALLLDERAAGPPRAARAL